ncbi:hypothetical protein AC579_1425 [Pseudocercospora musae]|uniref:Uncharacterized protein n=1 Tax=Pseudocercospora musae TaxID=113226 RepID=A0A139IMQ8_9PEZI|nr:hypothetical protein AC579_1425 [Pseudocercospora musae]
MKTFTIISIVVATVYALPARSSPWLELQLGDALAESPTEAVLKSGIPDKGSKLANARHRHDVAEIKGYSYRLDTNSRSSSSDNSMYWLLTPMP